ncbi:MAG TPA: class I SAM-dependent rRNA methyltransferase [Candidatus Saccharimonadales bacterium]|nr:class I SAM-dependent rRNA methyltransferase [Candidatus Saccharimonadales bacterium]
MHAIQLKPHEDRRLRAGHPWIFSNEIAAVDPALEDGAVGAVLDARGAFLGQAYFNRHSLIAARMLTRSRDPVDAALVARRIRSALELRARVLPEPEFGRLVFGEADRLPGLVVDRYGDVLVAQLGTLGMERLWPWAEAALRAELAPRAIYLRSDSPVRAQEGLAEHCASLDGPLDGRVELREHGAGFVTDVVRGQKTGWFYDQRDNRGLLQGRVSGARVLDAFCYAGAWSVLAARWGAREVLGLDASEFALELARENADRNGVSGACEFRRADVFQELKALHEAGQRFDVVVLDPPALIKSRARLQEGVRGYHDLNRAAMRLLQPGGALVTCSCSHLLPREEFLPVLSRAAHAARAAFRVAALRGQAADHPVLLAMRETDYLKCAVLEVL